MSLPIFQAEIKAGLGEAINDNCIAFQSVAKPFEPSEDLVHKVEANIDRYFSKAGRDDWDLYWMNDVLVSIGWNQNDDVFDSIETFQAKGSPVNKQFNFMHNEEDIIGHIVASLIFDGENIIEGDEVPESYDIVNASVLYRKWQSPELQERMDRIIAEIPEGKWFVSMECLFKNFDYILQTSAEEFKVVTRDQATAHLTRHLRRYGGTGEYNGCKIGRLLRNFTFSGKGLVDQPANPRSVILHKTLAFVPDTDIFQAKSELIMDNDVKVQLEAELAKARKDAEELKAKFEKMVEEARASDRAKLEEEIKAAKAETEATQTELAEAKTDVEAKATELEAKTKELDEVKAELAEAKTELADLEAAKVKAGRITQLVEVGVEKEAAEATVEKWAEASDEQFADIVELHKEKARDMDKKKDMDKKDDEEDEEVKADLENVEEEAEASLSVDTPDEKTEVAQAALSFVKWVRKDEQE